MLRFAPTRNEQWKKNARNEIQHAWSRARVHCSPSHNSGVSIEVETESHLKQLAERETGRIKIDAEKISEAPTQGRVYYESKMKTSF